ncbi:hypothetical protein MMC07_007265 [Pseudocyphellaria aurata]|nr:hypothetical protein [Pseudocyphellaria aurata]
MDDSVSQHCEEALHYLNQRIPSELDQPAVGVICGSGLGGLANSVLPQPRLEVPYMDIPHFPQSKVHGHAGKLVFGLLESFDIPMVLMVGRAHYYEGNSIQDITFPIRLLRRLGVKTVIVTNAAGGLNSDYAVGDIVVLNDHLNLAGLAGIHPLRGPNADDFGTRFPALSDAYDLDLRRRTHQMWKKLEHGTDNRRLHEGVYAFVGGPTYETRAESRLLRNLGADVVGMSTVPEIIVARHCSMRVLALSLVTNIAVLDAGPRGDDVQIESLSHEQMTKTIEKGRANHEEVLDAGAKAAAVFQASH